METVLVVKRYEKDIAVRCPYCMEGHRHRERERGEMLGVRRASCGRGYYEVKERPLRETLQNHYNK